MLMLPRYAGRHPAGIPIFAGPGGPGGAVDPAELVNQINTAFVAHRDKTDKDMRKVTAAVDDLSKSLGRLIAGGGGAPHSADGVLDTETGVAFNAFMRLGDVSAMAASSSGPDSSGYSIPQQLSSQINKRLTDVNPMRQVSRTVRLTAGDTFEELDDHGQADSGWVAERQARPHTRTPELGLLRVPTHEVYCQPKATQKLLDDSSQDLAAWLTGKASEAFIEKEGDAFTNGNGVGKPRGFLTYETSAQPDTVRAWGCLQHIMSGDADGFVSAAAEVSPADCLIDMTYTLKAGHRAQAVWQMNSTTAGVVRKFKDLEGRFIWQDALAEGQPPLLLGRPVVFNEDMPGIAPGATPIALGDFQRGYIVVDRQDVRVLRDPFTDKPNVLFYTTKRVGGGLQNSEAIKLLKIGVAA